MRRSAKPGSPASMRFAALNPKIVVAEQERGAADRPENLKASQCTCATSRPLKEGRTVEDLVHGMLELHGERDQPHTLWISAEPKSVDEHESQRTVGTGGHVDLHEANSLLWSRSGPVRRHSRRASTGGGRWGATGRHGTFVRGSTASLKRREECQVDQTHITAPTASSRQRIPVAYRHFGRESGIPLLFFPDFGVGWTIGIGRHGWIRSGPRCAV